MIEITEVSYKLYKHINSRTDLVRWCVVALSYRVNSVQETAKTETEQV